MTTFGYARVSDIHQNEDRQIIAMSEQGIPSDCVFADKQSGKDFERPAYKGLSEKVCKWRKRNSIFQHRRHT